MIMLAMKLMTIGFSIACAIPNPTDVAISDVRSTAAITLQDHVRSIP